MSQYINIPPTGNTTTATAATDQVSLTISGLNGNADGDYEIWGYIKAPSDGANNAIYTIQPNSLATNQAATIDYTTNTANSRAATTDLQIVNSIDAAGANIYFLARLSSRTGLGAGRMWSCTCRRAAGTAGSILNAVTAGQWTETSTNITSIRLMSDYNTGSAGLLAGSYFKIRRLLNG